MCKIRRIREVPTQTLCTLVSMAIRFGRREFGLPGKPYGIEKLMELDAEN